MSSITIEQVLNFLYVLLNPVKSPVPWAIGGALLIHLYNVVKEALIAHGYISGPDLSKLSKKELVDIVERNRTKIDRLIIEKKKLIRELEKCRFRSKTYG